MNNTMLLLHTNNNNNELCFKKKKLEKMDVIFQMMAWEKGTRLDLHVRSHTQRKRAEGVER